MLTVQCIEDVNSFIALGPQWNQLLQQSRSNSFALTWEWISLWWEVYGADYKLFVLTAQGPQGELWGVAPLMIGRGNDPVTQHIRTLMFIGQGVDVTPEYLDLFAAPEKEPEVVTAFSTYLAQTKRQEWDIISFKHVLLDSVVVKLWAPEMKQYGIEMELTNEGGCYYADLGTSWDDFLKAKTQHFRKRWNNTRNRLYREGEVKYLFVPEDVSLAEAYEKLVELNRERWGEEGASFRSERYIQFHRELCQRIEPHGWLILALMTLGDKIIAAKYDYLYAGKIWGNQGGWSREYQQKKVGEIFIGKLLEWGMEKGIREYDFLGGEAEYKERWGTHQRRMVDIVAHNTTARGQTVAWAQQGKAWLREHLPEAAWEKAKELKRLLRG